MDKVAIIRRNGLGDLLAAYPLILYLRKMHPHAAITLFVDARNAPLIPFLPPVEEVVIFPPKGNKYWNAFRTALRFRGKYDLALSAKTSPMKLMNYFLFWLKAKNRVAYVDKSWHSRLINQPLVHDEAAGKGVHQALKTLRMLNPHLSAVPEEFYPRLSLPSDLKNKYRSELLPFEGKIVVLASASTTRLASRFPVERYADLLNRLASEIPFHLIITGQPQDAERAKALAQRIEGSHSMHFPRSFDEFMVLLNASDLYFVGDGGVAHIGAGLGKKAVVLFGETNPLEWAPLSKEVQTFYHPKHVGELSDEPIYEALKRKLEEVVCERSHL